VAKSKKGKKPSVKVNDLQPNKDAKGGALNVKYSSLSDKTTSTATTQKVTGGYDLVANKKI